MISDGGFDAISLGILWDRLISITDEILLALVRTSFSTIVRESYDLSCILFDADGRALAQGSYSVPSFTGTAPATLRHMLARFPPPTLQPGDVIATNDPWQGTGHLPDISVMRPVFSGDRLVGYTMSVTHLPDIGGLGFSATASQVYEEGLRLPICKLMRAGQLDDRLIELIAANVRVSEQVVGDLIANISCNEVGGRLLVEFMKEYGIEDLGALADAIITQSETAMCDQLRAIPRGRYANRILVEGEEAPIVLACTVEVSEGRVAIDFEGTGPAVRAGINVPLCYTRAMASYAVKCLTIPKVPNNEGSLRRIAVAAPEGSILNAQPPCATGGRHVIGHFVPPLIFGALADAIPERVQADSGMQTLMSFQGIHRDGRLISSIYFAAGGFGALAGMDGAATTPGPSNMTGTSIEVWENSTGMLIEKKALLPDSGGPGEYRGGLGQEIVLRNDTTHPLVVSLFAGRTEFPPAGICGGKAGALREFRINRHVVHPKARYQLKPGDCIEVREAGGGGFGDPRRRCLDTLREDARNGFVTANHARLAYGVEISSPSSEGKPGDE